MKRFDGFRPEKAAARETLPAGGYVLKIMNAEEQEYTWGSVIVVSFDVAEGDKAGFYAQDYRSQQSEDKKWRGNYRLSVPKDDGSERDGWTKRSFNNFIWALEASNPGYHFDWDERTFKGKLVGGLFRDREWEYDGRTGWTTECCSVCEADAIRQGRFKMPKPKPLGDKKTDFGAAAVGFSSNANQAPAGFEAVNMAEDDLPF